MPGQSCIRGLYASEKAISSEPLNDFEMFERTIRLQQLAHIVAYIILITGRPLFFVARMLT